MSQEISRVAVIGAGTMGAAIVQHFLMKSLNVLMVDLQQESLNKGFNNIDSSLQEAVDRRIISIERKKTLLSKLEITTDYGDLKDTQFVVEAVFEDISVKQSVFKSIENNVNDDCIIASNTSSFSITELGSVLKNQDRFLGVHYFYHAAKNKLIELIPGKYTSNESLDRLTNFYYDNDKAPIIVADVYGFAVNRFFVPWLNEAVRLNEEGLGSIAAIDEIAVDVFGIGMGPFALMNATGIPITLHSSITLEEHFGPMYAPAQLLRDQIDRKQNWDLGSTESKTHNKQEITERLIAMSLGVAAQLVSEGVTGITETDLGARLGLRWPVGPFELMNQHGISEIEAVVKKVFAKYDLPIPSIFAKIDRKKGFNVKHVQAHVMDNVGLIEFNRPDAMNALNPSIVSCLSDAFDELNGNNSIEKIILFGRGKAFVAGADIKYFVENIESNQIGNICDFTEYGQNVFNKIANSEKQTIAYIDGLALGGGLELALSCDYRIASKRLVAAFPETGIGIYPGLGGTQRTSRLIGKGLAKYLIATGANLNADEALKYGLVSDIVNATNNISDIAALAAVAEGKKADTIEAQTFSGFGGEINDALFENPVFKQHEKGLRRKAPLALRKAMSLVDDGSKLALAQGLQLELDGLSDIFSTKDAYAGLSGINTGKPAKFTDE